MPTLSLRAKPVPLYPFFGARLSPAPLEPRRDSGISIVFLQGGGLSQDQLDRVPLNRPWDLSLVSGWIASLFAKPVGKD